MPPKSKTFVTSARMTAAVLLFNYSRTAAVPASALRVKLQVLVEKRRYHAVDMALFGA